MPATYSINIGTQYESQRKSDIVSVLKELPDNTNKLITPRDVRDAFLTTWASFPIKQTRTSAGIEYIGIDSGNPGGRDIKQKIFFGKRSFGSLDVMTESLLGSDTDIFIYNTKSDSLSQDSTRVSLLAGTNSSLFGSAPYIESLYSSSTDSMHLNIRNPQLNGGSINLSSQTGNVLINGIRFPKISENTGATNGKILRYVGNFPNGYLQWSNSDVVLSSIGITNSVTNIYGGTVSLNGSQLEFVSTSMTPTAVGGIPAGFSFSSTSFNGKKWPLSEVIRKLLYPKVPPSLSILSDKSYVEIGRTSSISLNWKIAIYPRDEYEYVSDYVIIVNNGNSSTGPIYSGLSFSGTPGTSFSGTSQIIVGSYSNPTMSYATIAVTDIWKPVRITSSDYSNYPGGFSYSATASIYHIYPIYYGFSANKIENTATFNSTVTSLSKSISPYPGQSQSTYLDYSGTGYLYFIYHNSFPTPISRITDGNGFIIHDMADPINSCFASASNDGFLVSGMASGITTQWKVWRTSLECSFDSPNKINFRF